MSDDLQRKVNNSSKKNLFVGLGKTEKIKRCTSRLNISAHDHSTGIGLNSFRQNVIFKYVITYVQMTSHDMNEVTYDSKGISYTKRCKKKV